jgi:hypothetical protein
MLPSSATPIAKKSAALKKKERRIRILLMLA